MNGQRASYVSASWRVSEIGRGRAHHATSASSFLPPRRSWIVLKEKGLDFEVKLGACKRSDDDWDDARGGPGGRGGAVGGEGKIAKDGDGVSLFGERLGEPHRRDGGRWGSKGRGGELRRGGSGGAIRTLLSSLVLVSYRSEFRFSALCFSSTAFSFTSLVFLCLCLCSGPGEQGH